MGVDSSNIPGIRIKVSADNLVACLVIDPDADVESISEDQIDALAADRNFIAGADRSRIIREFLEASADAPRDEPIETVIARGRAPEHGVDGHILFEPGLDPNEHVESDAHQGGQPAPRHPEPNPSPGEAVDFYNQSAFTVVSPGQPIGRIVEPTPGADGFDVTGKPIAAKAGRQLDVAIEDSILGERDGRLISQASGIIEYAGSRLRVLSELNIAGNIDFSTGNVSFPGDVNVAKGVKDCFSVHVGGSLVVRELVEAANICVAVDTALQRGMAARAKGSLKTGRDLTVNYLDNAEIVVGRDLHVIKEISACNVQVGRRIIGPTAAIVGGQVVAGHRCELGQIGSESGTRTWLTLGRLTELDHLAIKIAALQPACERQAARTRKRLETISTLGPNLTPEQAQELAALQFAAPDAEAWVGKIREALERMWQTHRDNTLAELIVNKLLYAGVRLSIGRYEALITQDLKGPLRIAVDASGEPRIGDPARNDGASLKTVATLVESDAMPDLKSLAERSQSRAAA